MAKFFAICQYYEPFTMGGSVWPFKKYVIDAEPVYLSGDFKGFVFTVTNEYRVHELTSGGLLGADIDKETAIQTANRNIEETPDLKEQIAKIGPPDKYPEVETNEALRRIAKGK